MSEKMKQLVKLAIEKLIIDGDSESILLGINLEIELQNNQPFKEMLDA